MNPVMKSPSVLIGTLVLLSMILSLMLVPRGVELGYLHFRNNEIDQATHDFEHLYAKGDRSATTISSLIKLAESRSDPDKATGYLKEYIDGHPADMTAWRQLLELYREAMKPEKYVETLVKIQEIAPSVEQARELEQLYRFNGPDDVHAVMLRNLIGMGGGSAEDFLMLAQYDAATDLQDEAIDMLDRGQPLLLKTLNEDAAELQVSLLIDHQRVDDALAVAGEWVKAVKAQPKSDPWVGINIAQIFLDHGLADDARIIAKPIAEQPDTIAEVAAFYVLVLLDLNRVNDAALYLKQQSNGQVNQALLPSYIAVDIARHDVTQAFRTSAAFPPQDLSYYVVSELSRAAIDDGKPGLLTQLRPRFDDRFYREYPIVAAMIFLQDNQSAEAVKWLDVAETNVSGEFRDLTELEIKLGRRQIAYNRLKALSPYPENRDFITQIAALLVEDGFASEALPQFNEMRAGHPGVDPGWAIVAAGANSAGVPAWLDAQPDSSLDATYLGDLSNAAITGGNKQTMLAVAQRWEKLSPGDASRVALLDAYVANNDFQSAQALLPSIDPNTADLSDFYGRAVESAVKTGGPLLKNVTAYWLQRLKDSKTTTDTEEAVNALSDLGQYAAILPQLRQLAKTQPAQWGPIYGDALESLSLRDEYVTYQAARIQDPAMSRDERRDIAYNLLDFGAKAPAEQALRINLEGETPKSEDFDELQYLWGPRLAPEDRAWLVQRAARAKGLEKAEWLSPVQNAVVDDSGNDNRPVPGRSKADQLADSAQQAVDAGDLAGATQSYLQALNADPGNPVRLRDLAQSEFQQKHYDAAATDFDRYFKAGGKDPESDFAFGDLLVRQKRNAEAIPFFQQALDQINAEHTPSLQYLETKAEVLQRLGRFDEARQQYEALIKAHPKNAAIRADYANMLIEAGDPADARSVMEGQ